MVSSCMSLTLLTTWLLQLARGRERAAQLEDRHQASLGRTTGVMGWKSRRGSGWSGLTTCEACDLGWTVQYMFRSLFPSPFLVCSSLSLQVRRKEGTFSPCVVAPLLTVSQVEARGGDVKEVEQPMFLLFAHPCTHH